MFLGIGVSLCGAGPGAAEPSLGTQVDVSCLCCLLIWTVFVFVSGCFFPAETLGFSKLFSGAFLSSLTMFLSPAASLPWPVSLALRVMAPGALSSLPAGSSFLSGMPVWGAAPGGWALCLHVLSTLAALSEV